MGKLQRIRDAASWADILQGQLLHIGLIVLMTQGAFRMMIPDQGGARLWGLNGFEWAVLAIVLAVVHQVIVAIVFRLELYKGMMTRLFGRKALGVWGAIFMPLLMVRPLTIGLAAWLDPVPITAYRGAEIALGCVLLGLAIVTMHSVVKYFTIRRALGGDHFDDAVIAMPMVREGMFKYTSNGMYGIVFLGLWGIALIFGSWNALVAAFFQHCYIWVHMYLTEAPDMDRIYGE